MTPEEAASFIIKRWIDYHTPQAIMMQMICLGVPLTKREILKVIKLWVDLNDEATTLKARRR